MKILEGEYLDGVEMNHRSLIYLLFDSNIEKGIKGNELLGEYEHH